MTNPTNDAEHVGATPDAVKTAPFRFVTDDGRFVEIPHDPSAFFCVCVDGMQVGDACDSPAEAEHAIKGLLAHGHHASLITVEAYRHVEGSDAPVGTIPYNQRGCWSDLPHED